MRRQWLCALLAVSVCLALVTTYAEIAPAGAKGRGHPERHDLRADIVDLGSFHFLETTVAGRKCIVSRTGYTGEVADSVLERGQQPSGDHAPHQARTEGRTP